MVLAFLLLGLLLAGGSAGSACHHEDHECLQREKDEAILLQRLRRTMPTAPPTLALALEGGGFKQQAALAGLFPALLNAGHFTPEELMSAVNVIATSSGGAWFFSMFAYSESYLKSTLRMVKSPNSAGKIYWSEWIEPFLTRLGILGKVKNSTLHLYRNLSVNAGANLSAGESIAHDFLEILFQLAFATEGEESKTWEDIIQVMLHAGGLTGQETLGSNVNHWAKGKIWLAGTSISTPGGKGPGSCHDPDASGLMCASPWTPKALVYGNTTQDTLSYSGVAGAVPLAGWTPARLSVVMGSGADQESPMKFCPSCDGVKLKYNLGEEELDSALESLAFNSNVPLTSAVTANSAFLGLLIVLPFFDAKFLKTASDALAGLLAKLPFVDTDFKQWFGSKLFKLLTCDWTEWCFMAAEPGHAFQKGMQVVQKMKDANGKLSQQTFTNLVERQLLGMVDSGLTDNTAIGHAVSSGAREIFYMGQVMSNGELEDFYRVFAGKKTDTPLIPLTALDFCPFCKANFQVFQQTESEVKSKLQEVSQFFKISPTSSAVTGIRVATLNLTTSQCDYFGIEADRAVTLNLVVIESPLFMGGFAYSDYATMVQDIMDAFRNPENSGLVNKILRWLKL